MKSEQTLMNADELPLTDELVSAYLQDNPEFFNRNNELMTGVKTYGFAPRYRFLSGKTAAAIETKSTSFRR